MLHWPVPYCSMADNTAAAHVPETCFCVTTVDYSFSNMQCRWQVLNTRYKWGKTKRQSDPCLGIGISATFFRSSKMTPNVPIVGCVPAFLVEKNLFECVQNSRIKNKGKGDCDNLSPGQKPLVPRLYDFLPNGSQGQRQSVGEKLEFL